MNLLSVVHSCYCFPKDFYEIFVFKLQIVIWHSKSLTLIVWLFSTLNNSIRYVLHLLWFNLAGSFAPRRRPLAPPRWDRGRESGKGKTDELRWGWFNRAEQKGKIIIYIFYFKEYTKQAMHSTTAREPPTDAQEQRQVLPTELLQLYCSAWPCTV